MSRLSLLFALPLLLVGLAFGQATKVPTCNGTNGPNCTDYFGVGNYANSPLPAGTITGFTLVSGGSGYANPLVVTADPTGSGASATANVTAGVITGITGGGGAGYIMPQVTIVDVGIGGSLQSPTCGGVNQPACGSGAMAEAVLGGPFTGGMLKFLDPLVDLKTLIATPDVTTFPGSDYYEIALVQYTQKLHSSLPATTLRGYVQVPTGSTGCPATPAAQYLGPLILAQKNRPVRVKFTNCLAAGAGGDLFIPVDTTYMGAGTSPSSPPGTDCSVLPRDPSCYTQNRATLHLHGGATPWISDGTPHQWTVPVGETAIAQKGDSAAYVPDMWFDATGAVIPSCAGQPTCSTTGASNNPGQGSLTFFWTNQQGGRLMFYHDHAYGLTRLNVYAGEAAGYLLVDPAEEDKLAAATAPGTIGTAPDLAHLIPLVIQDKSFVPSSPQLAAQDPTWVGNFGATPLSLTDSNGDLWFPHVYITNQNPADPGGANGFGRWDYGPWFFPPMTTLTAANPPTAVTVACTSSAFPGQTLAPTATCPTCGCPITPNPSGTPEGFMDTPVVNGVAYPVLHVAPAAYRLRILAAGNDRSWNLSWFVADPTQNNTEVAMLPAVPPTTGTALPLCSAINPVTNPSLDMGLAMALLDATGNPMNGTGLPGNCWPNYGRQAGIPAPQTMWAADGRAGGAPDPRNAGPPWIQIGTEGGLLPAPVVIPATPVNYEQNTRSITVTNVAVHGLWLGPAERADVIVDFSQFAGKTLILYNDAPTPAPAFDSRLDYFTGDGDQSSIGGAPNTQPGYGPNTRTVLQVTVDQIAPNPVPFSLAALRSAFASTATTPGLFVATQPTTIVPEAIYNSAYNANFPNTYASIAADNLTFTPIAPLTFDNVPCPTTITPIPPAQCATLDQKAIQELFTLDYGRMNATLGTELPLTNFLVQTTLPFGYAEWPTEITQGGQTELWKITHNGVDTHFIHFHLFNVQVVNRMGWDGTIRPPEANEVGWKDTVRMNPLEDILVALQPITPSLPFPLPDSIRLLDVTMPAGTFPDPIISGINPNTGNADLGNAGTTNALVNFGWEYVWHCHILGHEENDMMRPIIHQVAPPAPINLVAAQGALPNIVLTWTDNSASEDSFTLQRSTTTAFLTTDAGYASFPINGGNSTGFSTLGYGQTVTFTDTTGTPGNTYYYRVQANDSFTPQSPLSGIFQTVAMSSGWSNIAGVNTTLLTPAVTFTGAPASAAYGSTFVVTATTNSSSMPTIAGTAGVCSVGAVSGTPASSMATVTMTSGTGTCLLTATWAADAVFTSASLTQTTTATLAVPTVSFTGAPASAAYLATFTVTATTNASTTPTIIGNAVCSAGAVSGTSPATSLITMNSGTGTCTLTASWAADANYQAAALTQTTTAALATPVITWPAPAAITYGTALSGTQLNATAAYNGSPVPGTFAYTPAAGTVLNAGTQTLSVSFVPTATTNFASASATVTLLVNPAPLTITASSPSMVYGGPVPAITPIYSGLVNGNLATATPPVCMTTATSTSPASPPTYPSTCSGATDPNYTISYVAGAVTINKATTTTTITANLPNPSIYGQIVTVSFSVAPQFSNAPTGSVTVSSLLSGGGAGPSCTATLTAGAGSCQLTFLTGGSWTLTASYGGDSNFLGSISAGTTQLVSSVSLSSGSLLFGNQVVGTTSAAQTVTLVNVGVTPLTISNIVWSANFSDTNNCLGVTLAPGQNCRINVRFKPTTTGVLTGTLTITDTDITSPQIVTLTGTGISPILQVAPTALSFTSSYRVTSAAQTVTVTNMGTANMTLNGISLGGSNPGQFAQTNNCGVFPVIMAPNASCTVSVTFTPTSSGSKSALLNVRVASPAVSQSVTLSGTVLAPVLSLSSPSLAFGNVTVGTTSPSQTVTVSNTGTANMTINGISLGGTNPGQFVITSNGCGPFPATLAPNGTCSVSVAFSPTFTGTKSATLRVSVAAPATSQSVALSGTGQ